MSSIPDPTSDPAALPAVDPLLQALEESVRQRSRHLLTLADRTPYAATYGCFDRAYWQYKVKDFASGMSQEALYPLALALEQRLFADLTAPAHHDLEALIAAAAAFSLRQQHGNGSVDDYFPFEQAAGATAFSLYGILETLALGRLVLDGEQRRRLRQRAFWLAHHRESGRLSNHEALISLSLARAAGLLDEPSLLVAAEARFERLLSWRSAEGWFEEYGGFDVGYETLSFACLRELAELLPGRAVEIAPILEHNFRLILEAAEPDGCLGGELFARGTWNLFAHGLLAHALDHGDARSRADLGRILWARFLHHPTEVRDDAVIQHHLWSDLRSLQLLQRACPGALADLAGMALPWESTAAAPTAPPAPVWVEQGLPQAGHLWVRHGSCRTHVSLGVGGAFRLHRQGRFVVQETQQALSVGRGRRRRTWLAHAPGALQGWEWERPDRLRLHGALTAYRPQPMTTARLVVLRLLMLAGGRFWADGIRALMQRLLIHARSDPRRSFERRITFLPDGLLVEDRYRLPATESDAAVVTPTGCSSFRHVVMSRVFHPYALTAQAPVHTILQRSWGGISVERRW